MTTDEMKAKYGRIANDPSQLEMFKNDLIDGKVIESETQPMQEILYADLKALRDGGELVPGMQYRITDYTCTTTTALTHSAGHVFDIIVVADNETTLNKKARAVQHEGDTYFANSDLAAWQLWYDLDNNQAKYAWADPVNGKGVIFRMIDEFNNDVPYDFKNIVYSKEVSFYAMTKYSFQTTYYRNQANDREIAGTPYYGFTATAGGPPYTKDVLTTTLSIDTTTELYDLTGTLLTTSSNYYIISVDAAYIQMTFENSLEEDASMNISSHCENNTIRRYVVADGQNFVQTLNRIMFRNNTIGGLSATNIFFDYDCYDCLLHSSSKLTFNSGCHNIELGELTSTYVISLCTFGKNCYDIKIQYGDTNNFDDSCHGITSRLGFSGCTFGKAVSGITVPHGSATNLTIDSGSFNLDLICSENASVSNVHIHSAIRNTIINLSSSLDQLIDVYAAGSQEIIL